MERFRNGWIPSAEFVWSPQLHPRDAHGRFISKNALVRMSDGSTGRVVGAKQVGDKTKIQVKHDDGTKATVDANSVAVAGNVDWREDGDWTPTDDQKKQVADDVDWVQHQVPGLDEVIIRPDHTEDAFATGNPRGFTLSDSFFDDATLDQYRKDWSGGMSIAGGQETNREVQQATMAHELGHTIMHRVEAASPKARKAIYAFLDEPVTPRSVGFTAGDNLDTPKPRWSIDPLDKKSAYANESKYEFWAEAVADAMLNGDQASESGKRALELAKEHLG